MIASSIAGSAIFPPLPSESGLALGMGLAVSGELHLPWMCVAALLGAVAGDLAAYGVGRSISGRARGRADRSPRARAALRWIERRRGAGVGLVVAGRFLPGGTMAVGISAGLLRFPMRQFLPAAVAGGLIWTAYGVALGFVGRTVAPGSPWGAAAVGICITVTVGVVARWRQVRSRAATPPDEPA
ncbi:hypothetical protein GCM10010123_25670 [Pilimelia anulata]|uniref:VTT domain-containing protein n=1 Tax=Pilimelia anulata TaxID=53371 RepID=A0A8J3B7D2_9ACTN|nr:DedA family protein [Pilimelia anulata]GGJ94735.1 hypothetical protein GCM10010123_25670 [Pilimelia anulata]